MARAEVKDVRAAIEKLGSGQVLTYKLPETFGSEFAHIQLNPEGKGKKYVLTLEEAEADKPTGKKKVFMQHNNQVFLAKWINQFWGELVK